MTYDPAVHLTIEEREREGREALDDTRFEYSCSRCGVVTIHGASGGRLGCGAPGITSSHVLREDASGVDAPDCPAAPDELTVVAINPDGERKRMGTMSEIMGVAA